MELKIKQKTVNIMVGLGYADRKAETTFEIQKALRHKNKIISDTFLTQKLPTPQESLAVCEFLDLNKSLNFFRLDCGRTSVDLISHIYIPGSSPVEGRSL